MDIGMDPEVTRLASDEEVLLHVRGFAVLRATYEAEGYYDETADGDPEEQNLYLIEVLDARRATRAAEAGEGGAGWPPAELGLTHPTVRRLFPVARGRPPTHGGAPVGAKPPGVAHAPAVPSVAGGRA